MKNVEYNGIIFQPFISGEAIRARVKQIASILSEDYEGEVPLLVCVLNGAFVFASDLFMNMTIDAQITFIRLKSYEGMSSTGNVNEILGLTESVKNRHIIIIEDIIDTGGTIKKLSDYLKLKQPASIKTVTLLYKPDVCTHEVTPDYIGFTIPPKFIIGYGLDIDGLGRNLNGIWMAKDEK